MNTKLKTWLHRHLLVSKDAQRCVRLVLKHAAASGKTIGDHISFWDIEPGPDTDDIHTLTLEIDAAMTNDANGIGGCQSYGLHAYYGDSAKPGARIAFRVDSEGEDAEGYHSEPPTKTGLQAQLMRHNEALAKTLLASVSGAMVQQQRTINRLSEQNEALQGQRLESFDQIERLKSLEHERVMEEQKEARRSELMAKGVDAIKTLGPALLTRKAASEGNTEGAAVAGLRGLFSTLTDDQMEQLKVTFDDRQLALLSELYNAVDTPH